MEQKPFVLWSINRVTYFVRSEIELASPFDGDLKLLK